MTTHGRQFLQNLAEEIRDTRVIDGNVAVWWLGQAGFVFKAGNGSVIYLDPYLSDMVERVVGFKRLSAPPLYYGDASADLVICSHEHPDHLDSDSLSVIARTNPRCTFAGPADCEPVFGKCGISEDRIVSMCAECRYDFCGIGIHTAKANHGELSPTALSYLLDFGAVKVLFTGDTSLDIPALQPLIKLKPDVLIPCINGAYGNMNALDASRLTADVSPRIAIPCHYGMFEEHDSGIAGRAETFLSACRHLCSDVQVRVMTPGERFQISPDSTF